MLKSVFWVVLSLVLVIGVVSGGVKAAPSVYNPVFSSSCTLCPAGAPVDVLGNGANPGHQFSIRIISNTGTDFGCCTQTPLADGSLKWTLNLFPANYTVQVYEYTNRNHFNVVGTVSFTIQ